MNSQNIINKIRINGIDYSIGKTLQELIDSDAIGNTTQPIYWNGSQFVATTHTLGENVPADAVFTDTTYGVATANNLGLIKLGYQPEQGSKNYPVVVDANNKAYVNVPWDDTDTQYTLQAATTTALGGIIVSAVGQSQQQVEDTTSSTTHHYYGVQVDSAGKAYVDVPWVPSQSSNGTVTGIVMNSSPVNIDNSGVADLGTVITESSVVTYNLSTDPSNSQQYKLTDNKTFTDIQQQHSAGKQVNIKSIISNRVYTLSYIDSNGAIFQSIDAQLTGDVKIYYLYTASQSNGIATTGSRTIEDCITYQVMSGQGAQNSPVSLEPNCVSVWSSDVAALYVGLKYSNRPCVYSLRFKTDNAFNGFFVYVYGQYLGYDTSAKIVCPAGITWSPETEYEISILFDGIDSYSVKQIALEDELQFGNNDYVAIGQ